MNSTHRSPVGVADPRRLATRNRPRHVRHAVGVYHCSTCSVSWAADASICAQSGLLNRDPLGHHRFARRCRGGQSTRNTQDNSKSLHDPIRSLHLCTPQKHETSLYIALPRRRWTNHPTAGNANPMLPPRFKTAYETGDSGCCKTERGHRIDECEKSSGRHAGCAVHLIPCGTSIRSCRCRPPCRRGRRGRR